MDQYRIATIPGDGIGVDTTNEAVETLHTVAEVHGGLRPHLTATLGCAYYLREGRMMPADGLRILGDYDSILFGAVGFPTVPDHISLWACCCPSARALTSTSTCAPSSCCPGCPAHCATGPAEIDMVCIREHGGIAASAAVPTAAWMRSSCRPGVHAQRYHPRYALSWPSAAHAATR